MVASAAGGGRPACREQHDPGDQRQDEAPGARAQPCKQEARRLLAGSEQLRLDAGQQVPPALGLAAMREGDDDVEPLAQEPVELVLGLRQAAGDESGTLRVERERLAVREGIELGGLVERRLGQAGLAPHGSDLVGLPDEVGRAVEQGDEVGRDLDSVAFVVPERDLLGAADPLRGRIDGDLVDLAQRALSEGGESADALDLGPRRARSGRARDPWSGRRRRARRGPRIARLASTSGRPARTRPRRTPRRDRRSRARHRAPRARTRAARRAAGRAPQGRAPTRRRARRGRARRALVPARRRGAAEARARSRD